MRICFRICNDLLVRKGDVVSDLEHSQWVLMIVEVPKRMSYPWWSAEISYFVFSLVLVMLWIMEFIRWRIIRVLKSLQEPVLSSIHLSVSWDNPIIEGIIASFIWMPTLIRLRMQSPWRRKWKRRVRWSHFCRIIFRRYIWYQASSIARYACWWSLRSLLRLVYDATWRIPSSDLLT